MPGYEATLDDASFDRDGDARQVLKQFVPGAMALVAASCVGVWVLHRLPPAPAAPQLVLARSAPIAIAAPRTAPAAVRAAPPAVKVAASPYGGLSSSYGALSNPYGSLYDPGFLAGAKPESQSIASVEEIPASNTSPIPLDKTPLPPRREVALIEDAAPLPPHRPAEFALAAPDAAPSPWTSAAPDRHAAAPQTAAAPSDNRNFVEKWFGSIQPSTQPSVAASQPSAPASSVAFAAAPPESRASGRAPFAPAFPIGRGFSFGTPSIDPVALGYDKFTAIYDISARAVYMPDGRKLEAHSGLGDRLDDPRYVRERARGPTPPHVYDLTPREEIFHGVQALRLTPVGDGDLFGRAGLLAHPYMLGPNGDSNGCVSVKDYDAFLRAYQNGQIKRLVVVAKL
jgi:Protein of unknown function (DUF2778)